MSKKIKQPENRAKQPDEKTKNTVTALSAICGVLMSGSTVEESLGKIASITTDTMEAKACSVMFYKDRKFSVKAVHGINLSLQEGIIAGTAGNALCGLVVKEKKTMTTSEIAAYGTPILPGTREFGDITSMISSPIMINGEPIGVINTYNTGGHVYTDEEKMTLQAIAAQSAAAIQLSKYREEAKEAKEALQDRKIIEKAKGIIMKQRNMTENKAYSVMRTKSMNTGKSIKEIAEAVIMTDEMKL